MGGGCLQMTALTGDLMYTKKWMKGEKKNHETEADEEMWSLMNFIIFYLHNFVYLIL